MLQLREAVLEEGVLGCDQLWPLVSDLLEEDRGGLVLQASHLERLHNDLVVGGWGVRLTGRI